MHPIERTADVERPDIVQCLQPVSAAEHPDFVLVEDSGVCAVQRGNVRGHERRARPVAHRDVEDEDTVVVAGFARATPPQEGIIRENPKST